ncbi:MAG: heme-copper oxidase subunit III [Nitrospirae bacterium]|nr:heme-copper oxidase subunit III [Nitrospirota bacterium]
MAHAAVYHGEHEISFWPLPTGIGAFFIPIALLTYFAWERPLLGLVLMGIVLAFLAVGLAGWANEFFSRGHEEGLAGVAIVLFIISEVVIFGSMFGAFWAGRIGFADQWSQWIPKDLSLELALWLTLILWASSVTIVKAERSLEHGKRGASMAWLAATMGLGLLFVILHMNEWRHLWAAGFTMGANMYGTTFYALTGVHTSHVIVGLVIQLFLLVLGLSGKLTSQKMTIFRAAGLYWHFVDVMWMMVASNAYVVGGLK